MIDEEALEQIPHIISGRSAAFFDLDGTMARDHMIFDFPAHLMDAGLFLKKALDDILQMNDDLGSKNVSYRHVAETLPVLYARGVMGQEGTKIASEAEKFVEARMGKVFHYSKGLVRLMRDSGRPAVAISGSPVETVRALARRLGMGTAFGTELVVRDGRFSGEVLHNFILLETKRAFFEKVVERLRLDTTSCFGFGDTEQDISFLGRVGHPVALNPSSELRTIALRNGWHIFGTAQDVVSEVGKLLGNADDIQG